MEIKGQIVEVTEGGNLKIKIDSPYFSAGVKYNFPEKSIGIGINEGIVEEAIIRECLIFVEYGKNIYCIAPSEILRIVRDYKSKEIQGSVTLYVIPIKALKPL